MNSKFYNIWIEPISKNLEEDEIEEHIRKHIKELETKPMSREWITSLVNLSNIACSKMNISEKEKTDKLYKHSRKHTKEFEKDIVLIYEEFNNI